MESTIQKKLKTHTIIGLLSLSIPLSIYALWIYSFNQASTQLESVVIFKNYFPEFLQGRWSTTLLSIFFCGLALFFCKNSLKLSNKYWKTVSIITLIFSYLLLFLNVFSMM
jgi:hypothetical protein